MNRRQIKKRNKLEAEKLSASKLMQTQKPKLEVQAEKQVLPKKEEKPAKTQLATKKQEAKTAKTKLPVKEKSVSETSAAKSAKQPKVKKEEVTKKQFGKVVVEISGLCKRYSKKADLAIKDVSFVCHEGEILGLLGHNGAGKSTTIKCMEGMLPFEKGKITICGYDIKKQPLKAKMNIGFVTDNHAVFSKMTGIQYISFMADVYKVPTNEREVRLKELESVFNLGDAIYNLISSYSHGMKQKICMMASLIHKPKLWILDEPMTGLDPVTMRAVQDYMKQYVLQGNAIIFSSHALNTVENICDRVVLIRKGLQIDNIDIKQAKLNNPDFNFEEYFLNYGKN